MLQSALCFLVLFVLVDSAQVGGGGKVERERGEPLMRHASRAEAVLGANGNVQQNSPVLLPIHRTQPAAAPKSDAATQVSDGGRMDGQDSTPLMRRHSQGEQSSLARSSPRQPSIQLDTTEERHFSGQQAARVPPQSAAVVRLMMSSIIFLAMCLVILLIAARRQRISQDTQLARKQEKLDEIEDSASSDEGESSVYSERETSESEPSTRYSQGSSKGSAMSPAISDESASLNINQNEDTTKVSQYEKNETDEIVHF